MRKKEREEQKEEEEEERGEKRERDGLSSNGGEPGLTRSIQGLYSYYYSILLLYGV